MIITVRTIFSQLTYLLDQLSWDEYNAPLSILSENSIGKHVRHVLEFFDLLIVAALQNGVVNYDNRNHDFSIENDKDVAGAKISELLTRISEINGDRPLLMEASYAPDGENKILVKTSFNRELSYNIEHAVHHMAIIKIAVNTVFPRVILSDKFGVAHSTLRFQEQKKS